MKRNIFFACIAMLILLTQVDPVSAQNKDEANPEPAGSLTFSASEIVQIRDQAKRVRWTEMFVDTQLNTSNQRPGRQVWIETIKAALFGENERILKTADRLQHFLSELSGKPLRVDESSNTFTTGDMFHLVQSYDCMLALPEWNEIEKEKRQALHHDLVQACSRTLISSPSLLQPSSFVHFQATRLYAGLAMGATEIVNLSLKGDDKIDGLPTLLRRYLTAEGLIYRSSLSDHTSVASHLLQAGLAISSASTTRFEYLRPWLKKTADVMAELAFPTGNVPEFISTFDTNNLALLFERGYRLFAEPKYGLILNAIYQQNPRSPEALLIGSSSTDVSMDATFNSVAFPQSGAALLRNVHAKQPLSVYLDTGLFSSMGDVSALLAIDMRIQNGPLTSFSEGIGTAGYNTVIVDKQSQQTNPVDPEKPNNGFIYSFKPLNDQSTYMLAQAAGEYSERPAYNADIGSTPFPVTYYHRMLYFADPFLIDFFRVRGGRTHDYVYHSAGDIAQVPDGETRPLKLDESELPLLKQADSMNETISAEGVYHVHFKSPVEQIPSEKLWFVDPLESQLITGKIDGHSFLVNRRAVNNNEANLFASVHEIIRATDAPDTNIVRLTLEPQPNRRDFQAVAIAIEHGDQSDIFLSTTSPNVEYAAEYKDGRIVFQGWFGHIRLKKDVFESLRLVAGKRLRYDTHGVELKDILDVGVVQQVFPDEGALTINFPKALSEGDILQGHSIMALSMEGAPVNYHTLTIDKIMGEEKPQKVIFQFIPSLKNPIPTLAAPARVGEQVLFENVAELIKVGREQYRLHYTCPTDVIVDGSNNRNRVLIQSSLISKRIRGESLAGVIQFHAYPMERIDGKIEFHTIP